MYKSAIDLAGLNLTLQESELISVFAPSDNAFDALPINILNDLLSDPNGVLNEVLMSHYTEGLLLSGFLTDNLEVIMADGSIGYTNFWGLLF